MGVLNLIFGLGHFSFSASSFHGSVVSWFLNSFTNVAMTLLQMLEQQGRGFLNAKPMKFMTRFPQRMKQSSKNEFTGNSYQLFISCPVCCHVRF